MAKISTKDWRNLPLKDWNTTTFQEYVKHLNIEKYGIPCVYQVVRERAVIKQMQTEYGNEVVKEFVEECVKQHKGNAQYPTVNFFFMYAYMRTHILPKVLMTYKQKKENELALEERKSDVSSTIAYF